MFNNYKKQPREENWQNIKGKLKEDRAYEKFGAKFDGFTSVPSPQNWDAIQNKMETPKPTYSRRIMAVAASLAMLFLIISEGKKDTPTYNFADLSKDLSLTEDLAFNLCRDAIPTLDILTPVVNKRKVRKKPKKNKVKQKRLLDIILADDDNIISEVDSLLIAELLRPANMLPHESMSASTGGYYNYRQGRTFKVIYTLPNIEYKVHMPTDTSTTFLHQLMNGEQH